MGLTGGIASGKSSVLQVLQQLGCAVIDVDVIARHGEWGARVVHSSSLVLPFFRWASPFYKAFQGLRGGEGFPSAPGWSRVPAPAAPPSFPLQTTLGIPCTLPSTAAFPPLLVILLQTKEAPMGSRIIVPVVTQSPRAGLEAPESDPAPPYATVVQPGYPAHRRIVEAFGTEVLLENGDIDRKALGDLIFNQPDRRHLLNAITHPEICREMTKETFKYFLRGEAWGLGPGARVGWGKAQGPGPCSAERLAGEVILQAVEFTLFPGIPHAALHWPERVMALAT